MAKSETELLTSVINIAGTVDKSVKKSIGEVNSLFGGLNKKALITKAALAAAFVGVAGAAYKVTKEIVNLGSEFQNAYKTIRVGTGATGKDLDDLKNDFKSVYGSVPADMEAVSTAIADYNTRLGLTGKELQGVSKQAILLANNLGGGNLTGIIEKSSQAFTAWNIPAEEMSKKMDFIFKASQSTGMSFENLAQYAQQNAETFKALGFDFDHTITLIGQMEKNGLNVTDVFTSLKKSIQTTIKNGGNAQAEFTKYTKAIKGARTETEAASIAAKIFGTKNGPAMAAAIRSGKLEVNDLTKAIQANGENITDLSWETMTVGEKFAVLGNKARIAFEPLSMKLLDLINKYMPRVIEYVQKLLPYIDKTGVYIKLCAKEAIKLATIFKNNWSVIGPVVIGLTSALVAYKTIVFSISAAHKIAAASQAIYTTAMGICTGATVTATGATTALGAAIAFVTSPIFLAAAAIGLLVAAGYMLYKNWDEVCAGAEILGEQIAEVWGMIADTIGAAWEWVKGVCAAGFNILSNLFSGAWDTLSAICSAAWDGLKNIFLFGLKGIYTIYVKPWVMLFNYTVNGFSKLKEYTSGGLGAITGVFSGVWGKIKDICLSAWNGLKTVFTYGVKALYTIYIKPWVMLYQYTVTGFKKINAYAKAGFNALCGVFVGAWNWIKNTVSGAISSISGAVMNGINALPGFISGPLKSVISIVGSAIDTIKDIFNGVYSVSDIFTGLGLMLQAAWDGIKTGAVSMCTAVKDTFVSGFSGLVGIVTTPLRGIVALVNKAIDGINSISVSFPSYVPLVGGKKFSVNIPKIPQFAAGGFTNGVSVAGEAGTEAVISFDSAYRQNNIGYLTQAARLLGIGTNESATATFMNGLTGTNLANSVSNNSYSLGGVNFAPVINIKTDNPQEARRDLMQGLRENAEELADLLRNILEERDGGAYGASNF